MFLHHISNDSEPVNDNICFFLGGEGRWNGTVLQALLPGAWHSILCTKTHCFTTVSAAYKNIKYWWGCFIPIVKWTFPDICTHSGMGGSARWGGWMHGALAINAFIGWKKLAAEDFWSERHGTKDFHQGFFFYKILWIFVIMFRFSFRTMLFGAEAFWSQRHVEDETFFMAFATIFIESPAPKRNWNSWWIKSRERNTNAIKVDNQDKWQLKLDNKDMW